MSISTDISNNKFVYYEKIHAQKSNAPLLTKLYCKNVNTFATLNFTTIIECFFLLY